MASACALSCDVFLLRQPSRAISRAGLFVTEETRHCEAWPLACRKAKGRLFRTRLFPTARTRIKEKAPPRTGPGSPLQHQIGVRKELLSSRLPRQFGAREMVPEARGEPCLLAQSSGRHPLLACPRQRPGTQYAGKRGFQ